MAYMPLKTIFPSAILKDFFSYERAGVPGAPKASNIFLFLLLSLNCPLRFLKLADSALRNSQNRNIGLDMPLRS